MSALSWTGSPEPEVVPAQSTVLRRILCPYVGFMKIADSCEQGLSCARDGVCSLYDAAVLYLPSTLRFPLLRFLSSSYYLAPVTSLSVIHIKS